MTGGYRAEAGDLDLTRLHPLRERFWAPVDYRLDHLGDAYLAKGEPGNADKWLTEALTILESMRHLDAAKAGARLSGLTAHANHV